MQTLSVVAVEEGALVLASPAGDRFRLPVDASLRSRLLATAATRDERRLSPREIQAHVRSGLSAEQVAAMTGVSVDSIERFVGPVLAERAYIVESALAVRLPPETEGARSRTFGAVMGERLDALAAKEVRWSSAKEPAGWVLAVRFTADDTPHDARWRFDPKHMALEPDNVEASTLSQQGVPAALTPRLRALEPTAPVAIVAAAPDASPAEAATRRAPEPDGGRFDSAAFAIDPAALKPEGPTRRGRRGPAPAAEAVPTADLLPAPRGRASG
ncbi:septation protein SepH, partial [Amnibacterium endophyticum]